MSVYLLYICTIVNQICLMHFTLHFKLDLRSLFRMTTMMMSMVVPSMMVCIRGVSSSIVMQYTGGIGLTDKSIRENGAISSIKPTDTSDLRLHRLQGL